MDRPVRKFVLWKCRNVPMLEKRLEQLKKRREEIIDESSAVMDGQPRAKYGFGDSVANKVIRLEQLDFSIKKLEYEIKIITGFRNSLSGYDKEVYEETIVKTSNIVAKAQLMGVGKNKLVDDRAILLRQVATLIGEYIDEK